MCSSYGELYVAHRGETGAETADPARSNPLTQEKARRRRSRRCGSFAASRPRKGGIIHRMSASLGTILTAMVTPFDADGQLDC